MESNDNTSSSSSTITTSTSSVSKPHKQQKLRKPNLNTPMHERCLKCRLYKFNNQCSLTMCKACCIASPSACKYTHHKQAKVGARQPIVIASETTTTPPPPPILPVPNIKEQLESIVQSKGEAFILYDRGTNSKCPRRIKPNAFSLGKEGELVHAYCYVAKDKRSFYLHHITRMEDWESINSIATPPPSPVLISAPSSAEKTIATSVEEWLKEMGMGQYWPAFNANGYDSMFVVARLDETTLVELLGVDKKGHRIVLLTKAKEIVL